MQRFLLFNIAYQLVLGLISLYYIPKLFFSWLIYGKYKESFKQKLGFFPFKVKEKDRGCIWIHAVSLGETKAIEQVAKKLKEKYPQKTLVISSITQTGHSYAKKNLFFADYHLFLPFDFSFLVNPLVNQFCPKLLIISETDLWYCFLSACKAKGAKIALFNAKISKKSFQRMQTFSFFSKKLLSFVDLILAQSEVYKKRFEKLGVDSKKIKVTGNLKFDISPPFLSQKEIDKWKKTLGVQDQDLILTIGSTHYPEEEKLLEAVSSLWKKYPNLKVLLVPRHPERFEQVFNTLRKKYAISRLSKGGKLSQKTPLLLIDAMGLLNQCYQISNLAVVAGSFVEKVGGHNLIEPLFFKVPVLYGPYIHSQPDMHHLLNKEQVAVQVTYQTIAKEIDSIFSDKKRYRDLIERGSLLLKKIKGSCERSLKELEIFFQKHTCEKRERCAKFILQNKR